MQQTERAYPGYFIAIDGGNGAGKSTVIRALVDTLSEQGHDILLTREPGGTPISEKIRNLLLDTENAELCTNAELLLFAAARAQHFSEKIEPALNAGQLIISDRFSAATVAFQGYAQGKSIETIQRANHIAIGDFKPDLNLILDLDPLIALERMKERGCLDRHEVQSIQFHQNARAGYLQQAKDDPDNFIVIDASAPPADVVANALEAVMGRLHRDQVTAPQTFLRSQESQRL